MKLPGLAMAIFKPANSDNSWDYSCLILSIEWLIMTNQPYGLVLTYRPDILQKDDRPVSCRQDPDMCWLQKCLPSKSAVISQPTVNGSRPF